MGLTLSQISVLFGGNGSTTGSAGGASALGALNRAERDQTKDIQTTERQSSVARDIAAFKAAVAGAKTPADLLANPQALKVLLTANGLGDQASFAGLATKALLSDPADPHSLVNKLSDTRWKAVAQTFNFATKGLATLQKPGVLQTIADGYAEVTWRTSLDKTTPGLSNALDFHARATRIASADSILGDATFRTVVTTALGIPAQIAFQPLQAQENAINTHVDVTKFKDPKFVEQFAQRYLVAAQSSSTTGSAQPTLDQLAAHVGGLLV